MKAHADVTDLHLANAKASSTVLTITMLDTPFASGTAAVVKARNTSMIATVPVARLVPPNGSGLRFSSQGLMMP